MAALKLNKKLQGNLGDFTRGLQNVYKEDLVSVELYGSGASGEFIEKHSNLNLLVVLKDNGLESLKKAAGLVNKFKFRSLHPVFFTEKYIGSSLDVFPIEFLDMQDNYALLWGKDVLKGLTVDTCNLRFQCEQDLKLKLLNIKQAFLRISKDRQALEGLLFKSFTSVMHILRNLIRLKGKQPAYLKQDILKEAALEFPINKDMWARILTARNKQVKLGRKEIEALLSGFAGDLEKIVDKL